MRILLRPPGRSERREGTRRTEPARRRGLEDETLLLRPFDRWPPPRGDPRRGHWVARQAPERANRRLRALRTHDGDAVSLGPEARVSGVSGRLAPSREEESCRSPDGAIAASFATRRTARPSSRASATVASASTYQGAPRIFSW